MKKVSLVVLAPVIGIGVKLLSVLFFALSDMIACRSTVRKQGPVTLPEAHFPETPEAAREYMSKVPYEALTEYRKKYWTYHFLIMLGLLDGGFVFLGILLQDSGIWIALMPLMALFTFLEVMILRSGLKEGPPGKYNRFPGTLSDEKMVSVAQEYSVICLKFHKSLERAFGKPWKIFCTVGILVMILLTGLQTEYFFRAREVEKDIWQLGRFQYQIMEDDTARVVRYTGIWKQVRVPASFQGRPVTSVGPNAFYRYSGSDTPFNRKEVTRIVLPDSLKMIEDEAFKDCKELKEVRIPEGTVRIGDRTFYGCWQLRDLRIPDSVTVIGDEAFRGCSQLTQIIIPEGVARIGSGAFNGCSGVSVIRIPDSVVEITGNPFAGCWNLREVVISENNPVFCIMDNALCSRTAAQLIWYPSSCPDQEYSVPDWIREIGSGAFAENPSLVRVILPDGLESIGEKAFEDCRKLEEAGIPDRVTFIGESAFSGCSQLKEAVLPEGLTQISRYTFRFCGSLTEIVIPSGVSEIGVGAFYGCKNLEHVTIPEGVTVIEYDAFGGCSSLARVVIPESVEEMGSSFGAFPRETVLIVTKGSYAEEYCIKKKLNYMYSE